MAKRHNAESRSDNRGQTRAAGYWTAQWGSLASIAGDLKKKGNLANYKFGHVNY